MNKLYKALNFLIIALMTTLSLCQEDLIQQVIQGPRNTVKALQGAANASIRMAENLLAEMQPLALDITNNALLEAAIADFENIQKTLANASLIDTTRLQLIEPIASMTNSDFPECVRWMLNLNRENMENLMNSTQDNSLSSLFNGLTRIPLVPMQLRLNDNSRQTFINAPLSLLFPSFERLFNNTGPCQNVGLPSLTQWSRILPNQLLAGNEEQFEIPEDILKILLRDRLGIYQEFMQQINNAAQSRLQQSTELFQNLTTTFEDRAQKLVNGGINTFTTLIGGSINLFADVWNQIKNTIEVFSMEPGLFAWIASPLENNNQGAANELLRGLRRPLDLLLDGENTVNMVMAPFDLGRQIRSLSLFNGRILGLFQHFANPATAPVFLTMQTLFRAIDNNGILPGFSGVQSLLDMNNTLDRNMVLKLDVANACLDYLNLMSIQQ